MADAEAVPTARFEWERLVRRIRMPKPMKLLALVLATYADPDGSRVRPGLASLADVTGDSSRNVKRIMRELRELQLIELISRGGGKGGNGRASEYQLTIPTDLLERVTMLDPNDQSNESGDTQTSPHSTRDTPVDNSDRGDTQMSPVSAQADANEGTFSGTVEATEGTFSMYEGTPRCPTTKQDHQPPLDQTGLSLPDVSPDRAREPVSTTLVPAA